MRPSEKYNKLIRISRLCSGACGADVADPNYKVNIITGLVAFCITVYFIFSVYTVQLKFSENWGILLESFCMVGSVFQGITKLITGIKFTKDVAETNIILNNIYLEYEIKNQKCVDALNKCVSNVTFVLKSVTISHFFIFGWMFTAPIILYSITGYRYMVMQFYLPGLDVETDFGYFATIGMQGTCMFFGAFGNYAGDLFMIIYTMHFVLFAAILEVKRIELNDEALDNKETTETTYVLIDIIKWHQKYILFATTTNAVFYWVTFVQIFTCGLSLVLTLFILLTGNWPGSYAYLLLEFTMLYVYCGVGTLVETTNDKFCDEIYAIHWYDLSVSQQKCVLLMLMKTQDPVLITVGGVMPLSVNTALQVTKSVYSIMMMILNFIE